MNIIDILRAIPSTEPATFNEFCNGLPDCPEKDDKRAWANLFQLIKMAEDMELVEIERFGSRIDAMQLTTLGAERVREAH